jgi:hypothetical protein
MRANSPHTRREALKLLICLRLDGWTDVDYANALCTSVRSIERWRAWLRANGYLPALENGGYARRRA